MFFSSDNLALLRVVNRAVWVPFPPARRFVGDANDATATAAVTMSHPTTAVPASMKPTSQLVATRAGLHCLLSPRDNAGNAALILALRRLGLGPGLHTARDGVGHVRGLAVIRPDMVTQFIGHVLQPIPEPPWIRAAAPRVCALAFATAAVWFLHGFLSADKWALIRAL